jgi:2-hydroxychromene-2-carboxylate isomerase
VTLRTAIFRLVTTALTSRTRRDLRRARYGLKRRMSSARPVIDYFHQADDPYSHLIAQLLAPLAERYDVIIRPWLVSPPDDSAAPERDRLKAYALRDAALVAAQYGLTFPTRAAPPEPAATAAANRALASSPATKTFAEAVVRVGDALWTGDLAALQAGAHADDEATAKALAQGNAERKRLRHYLGAMLNFEGEWYWGVDRLNHLEERLAAMGRDRSLEAPPLAPFRDMTLGPVPAGPPCLIEAWFSFRSPYSWIAFPRLRTLARHYGATLKIRYILPMIMRGLPVPPMKTFYIMLDTKREAERVGLPYGTIVDPAGAGAERCLAVLHHAVTLGKGEDFAELGMRAAFADGVDLASKAGLYDVARRAGLSDAETTAALADESWRETAEENRAALFDAGLWGAPTYRVNGGPAHWGQDRLWALEADIIRAMGGA